MNKFTLQQGIMDRFRLSFESEEQAIKCWAFCTGGNLYGDEIGFSKGYKRDEAAQEIRKMQSAR